MSERRYVDDPISTNVRNYFHQIEKNVTRNMMSGNWERAERWADLLWAVAEAADRVIWTEAADA